MAKVSQESSKVKKVQKQKKKRGIWLIIVLGYFIFISLDAVIRFFQKEANVIEKHPDNIHIWLAVTFLLVSSILYLVFSLAIWKWKKWGVYGIYGLYIALIINYVILNRNLSVVVHPAVTVPIAVVIIFTLIIRPVWRYFE